MKKVFVVEWLSKGDYDIPFDALIYMSDSKEDAISHAESVELRTSSSILEKYSLTVLEYDYDNCAADPENFNNFGFDSNAIAWSDGAYVMYYTE